MAEVMLQFSLRRHWMDECEESNLFYFAEIRHL
jgi:hypothetical protein